MVEFCCCNLKPRSFYLLMIFLSSAFMIYPITAIASASVVKSLHPLTITFMLIIILGVLYYDILSIIAFFHYVINDSINRTFNHFYVNNMYWSSVVLAAFQILYLICFLSLDRNQPRDMATIVAIHVFICIGLLVLTFLWATRLQSVMPPVKESIVTESADEEQGSESKADAPQPKASEPAEPVEPKAE